MSRFAATAETLPEPSASGEQRLAGRARDGDARAFAQLYHQHKGPLYRHAYRMLGSEAAAHDVVQEAFARAVASIRRTREELRFKAWIFRIATNLCLRQLTVRTRYASNEGRPEAACPDGEGDPERRRRRVEIARFVAEALEATPARYRQILLLRELEELSYEELATVLETTVPRVKVTLHRARSRFGAEFVAARLLADPGQRVACPELSALVTAASSRRELVRHLETCKTCRQRERRPSGELFALLPGIPIPEALATPPAAPITASTPVDVCEAGGAAGGHGAVLAAGGMLALAGGLVVIALATSAPIRDDGSRRAWAPEKPVLASTVSLRPRAATNTRPPAAAAATVGALFDHAAENESPGARRARAALRQRRLVSLHIPLPQIRRDGHTARRDGHTARHDGHTARRDGHTAASLAARSKPAIGRKPAVKRRWRIGDPSWAKRPLLVGLGLSAASVEVLRGKRRFRLRARRQLRPRDVLRVAGRGSFGLRLPGDQWLGVGGAIRLDRVPRVGDRAFRVRVTLISGWLRAKATPAGRGLSIRVGARTVSLDSGELRLRRRGGRVYLETLGGAYATMLAPKGSLPKGSGDGLARSVPPNSGLYLDGAKDNGFTRGLLGRPMGLRPIRGKNITPPRLSWKRVPGAKSYLVSLARDTDFTEVVRVYKTTAFALQPAGMTPGAYYWQVAASDGKHRGRPSKVFRFVVLAR